MSLPTNVGDARDTDLIPGSGRSHGGGNGNPLQYSGLENTRHRRTLAAHGARHESEKTEGLSITTYLDIIMLL